MVRNVLDAVTLGIFLGATLVIMLTPGPDMLYVLARTFSQGRVAGLVSTAGIATSILLHTLLAAFGLSRLLAAFPATFVVLRIVGGVYLLYLAYRTWRDAPAVLAAAQHVTTISKRKLWRDAFLTNMLNPKALIFFLAFLPQFASGGPDAFRQMLFLGFLVAVCSALVNGALALAAARASKALAEHPKVARSQRWFGAGVLAALAVRLLV